ncbi:MAG: hypothetical protein ACKPA9_22310 [Microcystis sp.]
MMKDVSGYVSYGFDAVVKFGGSLLIKSEYTSKAINGLEKTISVGKRILVIPGGGPTDKTIEAIDKVYPLHPNTHHLACARAQDQTGLIICDSSFSKNLEPCETLEEARKIAEAHKVPVLLPSRLIFDIDPFERTWEITSDGMAVWFAWLVSAPLTVVLTDVDGIFHPDDQNRITDKIMPRVNANLLSQLGHTAVDKCVPEFILWRNIRVWVIHGGFSDRLSNVLLGHPTIGTEIVPN